MGGRMGRPVLSEVVTVRVTAETAERLRARAERERRSVAFMCREGLEALVRSEVAA